MHLTFANIIPHTYKHFNSDVAASHSEVMPCGIVKLLLWSSEVKCSAYRAEGTLHARSALHLRSILHVPLAEHLVKKSTFVGRQKCFFVGGGSWIRTSEVCDNRFTVCPLWPLGNSPIKYGAGERSRTINLLITNQLLCH